jgi:sugar lactone lactonase YvrE
MQTRLETVSRVGLWFTVCALLSLACVVAQPSYTIQTFAGGALPINVPATSAAIGTPHAMASDTNGNIYIALAGYQIIVKLSPNGVLTHIAGTGISGFSGDGGPATLAQLGSVEALAVDPAGNLYVADSNRIRKISSSGIISTIAGQAYAGFSGDGGLATAATLNIPRALAVDSNGGLIIGDSFNHRIRTVSGGIINTIAGTGVSGFSGDGGPALVAQFYAPSGLDIDNSGNIFVADWGNSRIRRISAGVVTTVAGSGSSGFSGDGGPATTARLNAPRDVKVDLQGNLYIADSANSRVRKVVGGIITTFAGATSGSNFSGDGGPATLATFHTDLPSVAVDALGNVYIADEGNGRVRVVDLSAIVRTAAGGGYGGDGGPGSLSQLLGPQQLAMNSSGDLYIADTGNHRIRKISAGVITTVAGVSTPGKTGDGGLAVNAALDSPQGVALDSSGNLYISDSQNCVLRKISMSGIINRFAGNGTCSSTPNDGGPATSGQFVYPAGLAVDTSGNVYVADPIQNRVRKISTTGIITTVAGTGTLGFSGDGGLATSAQLSSPASVAVDAAGALYIADRGNFRVRKISTSGVITTVAGTGSAGYSGDGGPATAAKIGQVFQVALDASGNLYFADASNNRLRRIAIDGTISTSAGVGTAGFTGDGGPALGAQLNYPYGVATDASGAVFVADTLNQRVRVLIPGGNSCAYQLDASVLQPGTSGGMFPVAITTTSGCSWSAINLPSWVSVTGSAAGTGAGTILLVVSSNSGAGRLANIYIGGQLVTVVQATSQGCNYSLSNGGQAFAASGGSGVVTLTVDPGCPWASAPSASWVSVVRGTTGLGNGEIAFQAAANSGVARTATIAIGLVSFTVEQAAASVSALTSSASLPHLATGGGWTTRYAFTNVGSTAAQIRFTIFDEAGNPLLVPLSFPQNSGNSGPVLASSIDRTLAPGALLIMEAQVPFTIPAKQGWAQLLTDGSVDGSGAFRFTTGPANDHQAVVPLENRASNKFVVTFDNSADFVAGIAVANIGIAGNVGIVIRDDAGTQLVNGPIPMGAGAHTAFVLSDTYSATVGKRGTVELDAPVGGQISTLGIFFNINSFGFSSIPALVKP